MTELEKEPKTLEEAINALDIEAFKRLAPTEHGAKGSFGRTALYASLHKCEDLDFALEAVRTMAEYEDEYVKGMKRVHVQAFLGDESILRRSGKQLKTTDERKQTVLHYAAMGNAAQLIRRLPKFMLKKKDDSGKISLVAASVRGNVEAVEVLAPLKNGITDNSF